MMSIAAPGLLAASLATAKIPDPPRCTIPKWVEISGLTSTGAPDPAGRYCVVLRDFANNPLAGRTVVLDFSDCCDVSICQDPIPGQTLTSCTPPKVSAMTNAQGMACFTIVGAARDAGDYVLPNATSGPAGPCVKLSAEVVPLGTLSVLACDQNGAVTQGAGPGVNALDLSVLTTLLGANGMTSGGRYRARANYSGPSLDDAQINALDLSFLITEIRRASVTPENSSANGCASGVYCTAEVKGPNCP
jgi:hypothetical protein